LYFTQCLWISSNTDVERRVIKNRHANGFLVCLDNCWCCWCDDVSFFEVDSLNRKSIFVSINLTTRSARDHIDMISNTDGRWKWYRLKISFTGRVWFFLPFSNFQRSPIFHSIHAISRQLYFRADFRVQFLELVVHRSEAYFQFPSQPNYEIENTLKR